MMFTSTRDLMLNNFNGIEPVLRQNRQKGESQYYFFTPFDGDPNTPLSKLPTADVPDGTDPYQFRDAGYKVPSLTDTTTPLKTDINSRSDIGVDTSLISSTTPGENRTLGWGNNMLSGFSNSNTNNTLSGFGNSNTNSALSGFGNSMDLDFLNQVNPINDRATGFTQSVEPLLKNEWDSSLQKMRAQSTTKEDTNTPYGQELAPLLTAARSSLENALSGMAPVYPETPPQYNSFVQPLNEKMTQSLNRHTQQLDHNWQQQAFNWIEYLENLKRNAYLNSARHRYQSIYPVQNKINEEALSPIIDRFLPELKKHEGYKKNPYLDTRCLLTGGMGKRLTCEEIQKDTSMNLTQADKDWLCGIEKKFQEEYCIQDAEGRYTPKPEYEKLGKQYDAYPKLETYYYPQDKAYADAKKHLLERFPQIMDVLNAYQTDFYALPEPVQQALMDIAYNPGIKTPVYRYGAKGMDKRLKTGWPTLMQNLQDSDYTNAAEQVNRQGIGERRNKWIRNQVLKASEITKKNR